MAQLHLVLAYRGRDRADRPHVCYCGHDADAAQASVSGALTGGMFVRVERYRPGAPIVKHAEPRPLPAAPAEPAKAPKKKAKRKTAKKKAAPKTDPTATVSPVEEKLAPDASEQI